VLAPDGGVPAQVIVLQYNPGSPVTMQFALAAAKAEFVELDRPINEADFRWLESAGVVA
jgi:hypothetical protein